jgi:hypothetical protein
MASAPAWAYTAYTVAWHHSCSMMLLKKLKAELLK